MELAWPLHTFCATQTHVVVVDGDRVSGYAGGAVQLAVTRVEDAVGAADELVVASALAYAHALRVTGGVQLAFAAATAEQRRTRI